MERNEAINIIRNIHSTDKEKEALGVLIPELAESEDERIRKDIVSHFEAIRAQALYDYQEESDGIISSCNERIAYLERQKEQEPIPDSVKYDEGFKDGRSIGFKEGVESVKSAESSKDKRIRKWLTFVFTSRNEKFVEELDNYRGDVTREQILAYLEKQKELKPAECSKDEKIRKVLLRCCDDWEKGQFGCMAKEDVPTIRAYLEKQGEQFTHHEPDESLVEAVKHQMEDDGDMDEFVRKGIDDIVLKYAELGAKWQREQKPAEWNKFDKYMLAGLVHFLESQKTEESEAKDPSMQDVIKWVTSLQERFNLALKQAWSEEEKRCLDEAIEALELIGEEGMAENLKNLRTRPKQEWSEEDEEEKFFNLLHAGLYAMKVKIGRDKYEKAVEQLNSLRIKFGTSKSK